jgi:hypothetical protein
VVLPTFGTQQAACFDIAFQAYGKYEYAGYSGFNSPFTRTLKDGKATLMPGDRIMVPTGLIFDIPEGYSLRIHPRSGLSYKQGKYYILHFKQLFLLDGKKSDFSDDDKGRLNTIANLLAEWNLLALVDPKKSGDPVSPLSQIKILSHKEKNDWILVTKYNIGKKRRED